MKMAVVAKKTGYVRFIIVGLLFSMLAIQFGMRSALALAIIAMTSEGTSSNPDVPVSLPFSNNLNLIFGNSITTGITLALSSHHSIGLIQFSNLWLDI